ncbi:hypothetical protein NQ314_011287 [Rhamnusium bicolor]|uniref:Cns1/TTC4 wheel domain-containing protein n=1 Tax=Rhamnusium bicolor TaxID=1586634 RepID=A0AAV8XK50_9CUCU|nr:hypothetical protein NQ314_011287 [Rhamnusium bicolor]
MEHLSLVFDTFPEWDEEKKYKLDDLNMYFESPKKKIFSVDINKILGDILTMKECVVLLILNSLIL